MEHTCRPGRFLLERRAFMLKTRIAQSEYIMNIFYIIGVIVVVLFVAGFFGLHAWTKYLAEPARSGIRVANFEPKHGERHPLPELLVALRQYDSQKRAILNSDSRTFEIRLDASPRGP
jgi:hypothetical protein